MGDSPRGHFGSLAQGEWPTEMEFPTLLPWVLPFLNSPIPKCAFLHLISLAQPLGVAPLTDLLFQELCWSTVRMWPCPGVQLGGPSVSRASSSSCCYAGLVPASSGECLTSAAYITLTPTTPIRYAQRAGVSGWAWPLWAWI